MPAKPQRQTNREATGDTPGGAQTASLGAHPTAHAFKGLADWIEIFRAGAHTDSQGREATFSTADLDRMVANAAGTAGVPAVLGHPKDHSPAWAWAKALKRQGNSLLAKFSDIHPAFQSGVDSGQYRNRSVKVAKLPSKGWSLVHVGWLGAAPPAIELTPLSYAQPEGAQVMEFMGMGMGSEADADADTDDLDLAWALGEMAGMLRSLRESLIAKDGVDAANTALPDWRIANLAATADRLQRAAMASADPAASETNQGNTAMSYTQADIDAARASAKSEADAAHASAAATHTAEFTRQSAELATLHAQRQQERIGVQLKGWIAAGQVTPAEGIGMAEFMASIEGGQGATAQEFAFTAADKSAVKKTAPAWFAEFIGARKPLVRLGHRADPAGDAQAQLDARDPRAIAQAANEFIAAEAAKGRTVQIDAAVMHITRAAAG